MFRIAMIKPLVMAVIATAFIAGSAQAAGSKPFFEKGVERWGADYSVFEVKTGGANACYQACVRDKKCLAWTYHRPGTSASRSAVGECHLKSKVPHPSDNVCCVSGVMVGQHAPGSAPLASLPKPAAKATATKKAPSGLSRVAAKLFGPAELDEGAEIGLPELKPAAAAPPLKITPIKYEDL